MNPAETTAPLYPTQVAPRRAPELQAWRDGAFGTRRAPQSGKTESAYKNGIFGPGLGDVPSAEVEGTMVGGGPLRAYRDGVFNRVKRVESPARAERVTAFHDGVFGAPVGETTITMRETEDGRVMTVEDDLAPFYAAAVGVLVVGVVWSLVRAGR